MVDIQSKEVIDKISEELKVQPALEIPRAIADKIRLAYIINPEHMLQTAAGLSTDALSETIHTTHATKDTFLVGISFSVAQDASSDSVQTDVRGTPEGKASSFFLSVRTEPSTAGEHNKSIIFPTPFKLEKGSIISINNSTNTASIDAHGLIYFYEVDPQ